MDRSIVLVVFLIIASICKSSSDVDVLLIGILTDKEIRAIQIHPETEGYKLLADGKTLLSLGLSSRFSLINADGYVRVKTPEKDFGKFKSVELLTGKPDSYFRLYSILPNGVERIYDDNLLVTSGRTGLRIINQVGLEKYVAGVVEAETGKEKHIEFYKAQAIISRSYALNNINRYLRKGYNLNDLVDCQVYHGRARWEPLIIDAVNETKGKVLVDSEMDLITAAFHSNSGGETVSSEVVWSGSLSYLSKRDDSFSLNGEHATWERRIGKQEWLEYLAEKYSFDSSDRLLREMAINYEQKNRHVFFLDPIFKIRLKDIRADWSLNSTFFSIQPLGSDSLLLKGRGFGHGTGLSQEGAMRMAELGFSYVDILHFYYDDVHIIHLEALEFFRTD
jgi:stage II sporulation protein D